MSQEPTRKRFHLTLDGDNIPLWNRVSYPNRERIVRVALGAMLLVAILFVVFPLFWMASTALRPRPMIFDVPTPLLPPVFTLDNFYQMFQDSQFETWYSNTILVSLGVVSITVSTATLGGYGLTRIDIPFKRAFARIILFGYMFPAILLAIPMFILWRQVGMINSIVGLIFAETAVALPFSLWLMWKFFQTVPVSLEESAQMAGASRFRAFYEIALPMAKPGMIAIAVFAYAIAWNEFTIPQVLMNDSDLYVLTQGLYFFTIQNKTVWEQIMAASTLTIIPSFLFVFFLQKYLLRGFRAGGIG
jgi:multiple sugar transport system permease protein